MNFTTSGSICPPGNLGGENFRGMFVQNMRLRLRGFFALREDHLRRQTQMCDPSQSGPGPHQQCVMEIAKMIAVHSPERLGGHRGLVVWHGTGSGKTLTALGIMLAFWRHAEYRIIFATTRDNIRNNNTTKYARLLAQHFPLTRQSLFGEMTEADIAHRAFEFHSSESGGGRNTASPGEKRVELYSFSELANMLGLQGTMKKYANPKLRKLSKAEGGRPTVFILDEAQNIATPKYHVELHNKLKAFFTRRTDIIVFVLTATPGSTVKEWADLVNFVRLPSQPAFTETTPMNQYAGLVSFADISGDVTRYARLVIKEVIEPLDIKYYAAYLSKYPDSNMEIKYNYARPQKYFQTMRRAGSYMRMNEVQKFVSPRDLAYYKSRGFLVKHENKDLIISTKLQRAIHTAMVMPGKQYLYSAVASDIIASILEKGGWQRVNHLHVENLREDRYGILKKKAMRFILYQPRTGSRNPGQELEKYQAVLNASQNVNGEYVKIVIATGGYYEGLNILALRGVHLIEPLHSALADIQAVGRGLRYCGHAMLSNANDRKAIVFRYFATPPINFLSEMKGFLKEHDKKGKQMRLLTEMFNHMGQLASLTTNSPAPNVNRTANRIIYQQTRGNDVFQALLTFEHKLRAWAVDAGVFADNLHASFNVVPAKY